MSMNPTRPTLGIDPNRLLWERLVEDLGSVYDAHGVCAAASHAVATTADTTTLVALRDPAGNHYDAWICDQSGTIRQARWHVDEPAILRIQQNGKPAEFSTDDLTQKDRQSSQLWKLVSNRYLAAPLPYPSSPSQFTLPGVICLIDPTETCPVNKRTFQPIVIQVSSFLERALLRRKSDQQEIEFGIISEISTSLTSTLHLDEIIVQVTDAVRRVLGAESLTIGLTEPSEREVIFVEALMGPGIQDMPTVSFEIGQGIAGWVALHGEPAIVNDAYNDERFSEKVDRDTGYLTHSVLCVPLKIEKRVIGVLEAINKHSGLFDENDLRLLQAISGPLAIAIENALLHSDVLKEKRRIETIFASMSEGLMTTDPEGNITAANSALCSMLNTREEEVAGLPVSQLVKTRPQDFVEFYGRVISSGDEFPQVAVDLQRSGKGSVPVLISGTTIEKPNGSLDGSIFVFSDLSQVREVERMRDDFFHNIVHEFRTPLATILLYARLLRERKAIDDPVRAGRFLGLIERESNRLQKMVRQMLLLAKLEAKADRQENESTNINHLFDQLVPPMAERAKEKGLDFSTTIQTSLPDVVGSEETVYMILKNLVENAIKFTPVGQVTIVAWLDDGFIYCRVADEGIGIPDESIPNLFQRFYRTKLTAERGIAGTGLGLSMVKEGLEANGGSIKVESQEGKGTRFTIKLPIAEASNMTSMN